MYKLIVSLLVSIALSGCSTINMQPGPEVSPMAVAKCGTAHYNLCLMRPTYEELLESIGLWVQTVNKKDARTLKAFIEVCGWTYNDYVIEYDRRRYI